MKWSQAFQLETKKLYSSGTNILREKYSQPREFYLTRLLLTNVQIFQTEVLKSSSREHRAYGGMCASKLRA